MDSWDQRVGPDDVGGDLAPPPPVPRHLPPPGPGRRRPIGFEVSVAVAVGSLAVAIGALAVGGGSNLDHTAALEDPRNAPLIQGISSDLVRQSRGIVRPDEARCIAGTVVAEVGRESLLDLGLDDPLSGSSLSLLGEEDANAVTAGVFNCLDDVRFEEALTEALQLSGQIDRGEADCLVGTLLEEVGKRPMADVLAAFLAQGTDVEILELMRTDDVVATTRAGASCLGDAPFGDPGG